MSQGSERRNIDFAILINTTARSDLYITISQHELLDEDVALLVRSAR